MPKRSVFISERDAQVALICGAAFQRLAGEFIPKIGALQEEAIPPGAWPGQLGDLVACATNLAFALELYLKGLLTQLDLPVPPVHDLRKLYDAIPQPVKALIETVYDTSWPPQLLGRRRVSITLARGRTRWGGYLGGQGRDSFFD